MTLAPRVLWVINGRRGAVGIEHESMGKEEHEKLLREAVARVAYSWVTYDDTLGKIVIRKPHNSCFGGGAEKEMITNYTRSARDAVKAVLREAKYKGVR